MSKSGHLTGAVIRKEFRHIFRDRVSCLLLFVMPALLILLLTYALSFEVDHYDIVVSNPEHSEVADRLFSQMEANPKIRITRRIDRLDRIDSAFATGNVRAVVIYRSSGIDLFLDSGSPLISKNVEHMLSGVIARFLRDEAPLFHKDSGTTLPVRFLYNPSLKKEYTPLPGLVLMVLLLVCSIILGTSINKEKSQGSMRLLRLTRMSGLQIIAGKAIPYFLISLLQIAFIWLICLHFDVHIVGSLTLFFSLCILYSLCCLSLGLVIASWFDRPLDVLILCWVVLFIPNVFLSGFIFPLSSMEGLIRYAAELLPGTSFISAFRSIAFKGTGLAENLPQFATLAAETLVCLGLSLIGFKRRIPR